MQTGEARPKQAPPSPSGLPPEAERSSGLFLEGLDKVLPGRVTGLIITGSAAMGEYETGRSDLDFLALSDTALGKNELALLPALHRRLNRAFHKPELDGVYITWADLGRDPRGLLAPRVREGVFVGEDDYAANPVAWHIAARHPLVLRGPANPPIWMDEGVLKAWCRENLAGYWSSWAAKARTEPASIAYSLSREALFWGVTGVARIHATIMTGAVISKRSSMIYARKRFGPAWDDIIGEAEFFRNPVPGRRSPPPFRRRRRFLEFMDMAIGAGLLGE